MQDYNRRFKVSPTNPIDAHRPLEYGDETLKLILAEHHTRIVSKNLQISYKNILYQIQSPGKAYSLRKAKVKVCDHQGEVTLLYKGQKLDFKTFDKGNQPAPIMDSKAVQSSGPRKIFRPEREHPWRKAINRDRQAQMARKKILPKK